VIIIGGRVCAHCKAIKPRQAMAKLRVHHSEWADSWWETHWFCRDQPVCAAAATDKIFN
jgi:hypothetical protein